MTNLLRLTDEHDAHFYVSTDRIEAFGISKDVFDDGLTVIQVANQRWLCQETPEQIQEALWPNVFEVSAASE
jgi:hypothetical protein